ncbi:YtcA family lipoprotein [Labrenzia sp. 011]|uniref:YtcA family lipoprotein n=1 Tax=Labrenzia sp. 011 TaxID=2171494 RepID=UPI0014024B13|nr:YtcA family lipoprotein [Labrenzia sp. 011]
MKERRARTRIVPAVLLLWVFSGGGAQAAAPSVPMFGSYFPSWLLSVAAAVLLTVVLRILFVATGLENILRWRGAMYLSLVAGIAALIELTVF